MRKIDITNPFIKINKEKISKALVKLDMSLNKKKADQIADFLLINDEAYINLLDSRGFKRDAGLSKFAKKRYTITVAEFLYLIA